MRRRIVNSRSRRPRHLSKRHSKHVFRLGMRKSNGVKPQRGGFRL